ncbi:hypothetical protein NRB_08430 [Novosphingobium sp. 11B]
MRRFRLLPLSSLALSGATLPETHFDITLPKALGDDASGRLLLFAAPLSAANSNGAAIDLTGPDNAPDTAPVFVAGRDVAGFGPDHAVSFDAREDAFPKGLAALPAGDYRVSSKGKAEGLHLRA